MKIITQILSSEFKRKILQINKNILEKNELSDFTKISLYDLDYMDSVKKFMYYSITDFKNIIKFNNDSYFTLRINQNVIYVLVKRINDKRVQISFLSDYPLSILIDDKLKYDVFTCPNPNLFEKLHENQDNNYFYLLGEHIESTDFIRYLIPIKRITDIKRLNQLYLVDPEMKLYKISKHLIYENDCYIVWKQEGYANEKIVNTIKLLSSSSNYKKFNNSILKLL